MRTKKTYDCFICWVISISCVLLQYQAIISSYGILILGILALIICFETKVIKLKKEFLILFILLSLQQMITVVVYDRDWLSYIKSLLDIASKIFIICVIGNRVKDRWQLYRCFKISGGIFAIAIYIQTILNLLFDVPYKPIQILAIAHEEASNWSQRNRASGFFSEPQTFCTYLLPLLVLSLEKKEYKYSVFLTIAFILSGSSLGILITFFLWFSELRRLQVSAQAKRNIYCLFMIWVLLFFMLDIFQPIREKIYAIFIDIKSYTRALMINSYSYTNYLRLVKGWVTINELPLEAKLWGVGLYNFQEYAIENKLSFSWSHVWKNDAVAAAYFTSGAGVIIECGIFVALYYYYFLLKQTVRSTRICRMILICMLIQSLTSQLFFNGIFVFYFLFIYVFSERKSEDPIPQ